MGGDTGSGMWTSAELPSVIPMAAIVVTGGGGGGRQLCCARV